MPRPTFAHPTLSCRQTALTALCLTLTACGGGGGGGGGAATDSGGTPTVTPSIPTLTAAARWPAGVAGPWQGPVTATLDATGGLHLVAPLATASASPAGAASLVYGKRSAAGWSPLAGVLAKGEGQALAVNASGAAVVATGLGGTGQFKFLSASGTEIGSASASTPSTWLTGSLDLSLLDTGDAVFSKGEVNSASDTTLVTRVYRLKPSGALSAEGQVAPSLGGGQSRFFVNQSTPLSGVLLNFTDALPVAGPLPVLGLRSAAGTPLTFSAPVTSNALELFTTFSAPRCSTPALSVSSMDASTNALAGLLRVLATPPGGPTTCSLQFFRNGSGSTLTAVPITVPTGDAIEMSTSSSGTMPFVNVDANGRSTLVWVNSAGTAPVIELVTVSAANVVSAPATVASGSATTGTIVANSPSYRQNRSGTGALAYLATRPSGVAGPPSSLYVAKYTPGAGFSAPVLVANAANSWIQSVAVVIDAAGTATAVAIGQSCSSVTATPTSFGCTDGVPTVFTYTF